MRSGANDREFEFVVENDGKVQSVEVKKGRGRLNSPLSFRSLNPGSTAIKTSADNYGYNKENDILTIPLYESFLLAGDLAENKILV